MKKCVSCGRKNSSLSDKHCLECNINKAKGNKHLGMLARAVSRSSKTTVIITEENK